MVQTGGHSLVVNHKKKSENIPISCSVVLFQKILCNRDIVNAEQGVGRCYILVIGANN